MKCEMLSRNCTECFDKFRTMDASLTLCKACEAELALRLNEEIAVRAAERRAENARAAMELRTRIAARRPPTEFGKLLWEEDAAD